MLRDRGLDLAIHQDYVDSQEPVTQAPGGSHGGSGIGGVPGESESTSCRSPLSSWAGLLPSSAASQMSAQAVDEALCQPPLGVCMMYVARRPSGMTPPPLGIVYWPTAAQAVLVAQEDELIWK